MLMPDPDTVMVPNAFNGTALLTQLEPLYFKTSPFAAEVITTSVRSSNTTAPPPGPPDCVTQLSTPAPLVLSTWSADPPKILMLATLTCMGPTTLPVTALIICVLSLANTDPSTLPVTSPVTLPVKFPVTLPVTLPSTAPEKVVAISTPVDGL